MPEKIIRQLDEANTPDEALDYLSDFFTSHGFNSFAFIIPHLTTRDQFRFCEKGLSKSFTKRYIQDHLHLHDPIPKAATRLKDVITLHELIAGLTLSESEQEFIDKLPSFDIIDGLIVPTCGLYHARGYFFLSCGTQEVLLKADRPVLKAVSQYSHLRIDELRVNQGEHRHVLSNREREVLEWVGAGKSNFEVAAILGISEATVSTHLKRLFSKLGVHDRVTAALVGFKLGLLH